MPITQYSLDLVSKAAVRQSKVVLLCLDISAISHCKNICLLAFYRRQGSKVHFSVTVFYKIPK